MEDFFETRKQFEAKAQEIITLLGGAPPTAKIIAHLMMIAYHKGKYDELNALGLGLTPKLFD